MAPSLLHRTVASELRAAYDGSAEARSASERASWQCAERETFLSRLHKERKTSLLEVGAGAGHDSRFFADHGLQVVATDLSPQMVEMCRGRGLDAHVMDVTHLDLPSRTFHAAYSMNSLLHVPDADLEQRSSLSAPRFSLVRCSTLASTGVKSHLRVSFPPIGMYPGDSSRFEQMNSCLPPWNAYSGLKTFMSWTSAGTFSRLPSGLRQPVSNSP